MDSELRKYLSKIVNKLTNLNEKIAKVDIKITQLGQANGEAYRRVEKVVRVLCENQQEVYDELCESSGTIQSGTFFGE